MGKPEIDEYKGVLAVFIDDLDRCLADKVVQVLEAIKLFLDKQGCIFVPGADESVIRRYVKAKPAFSEEEARGFINKIIHMAPDPFWQQFANLPDHEIQYNFLSDALQWAKGALPEGKTGYCAAYQDEQRLKNALRRHGLNRLLVCAKLAPVLQCCCAARGGVERYSGRNGLPSGRCRSQVSDPVAQNKGHLHRHSVFHNLAILHVHFLILDPGALEVVEGLVGPGDTML